VLVRDFIARKTKFIAVMLSILFAFGSTVGVVAYDGVVDNETEHTHREIALSDANTYDISYEVLSENPEEFVAVVEALRAWANGSGDQMDVVNELFDRYSEKFGADVVLSITIEDPAFFAAYEASYSEIDDTLPSAAACLHTRRANVIVTQKQGGPNAQYCEWGYMETHSICLDCAATVSITPGTYTYTHQFIALPPNIQLCSRCGYSS